MRRGYVTSFQYRAPWQYRWQYPCCGNALLPDAQGGSLKSYLARHLDLLRTLSSFTEAWALLGTLLAIRYRDVLTRLDGIACRSSDGSLAVEHERAICDLASVFRGLPNHDFTTWPEPEDWIRETSNVNDVERTFLLAGSTMQDLLRGEGYPYVMRWLSIKRDVSVAGKVDAHRLSGVRADLWDVIRFRLSFASPATLARVASAMVKKMGSDVVRLRNYYLEPRFGPQDPYRGLHLEIRILDNGRPRYFEVQLVTVGRDAVGLIDHPFVHKPQLEYSDDDHRAWLDAMRAAANIADAAFGGRVLDTFVSTNLRQAT